MRLVLADVADTVKMQDETIRHVVVKAHVKSRRRRRTGLLPLPGETYFRLCIFRNVPRCCGEYGFAPSGTVPHFKRVAGASVDLSVLHGLLRRGKHVAIRINRISPYALIPVNIGH